MKRPDLVKKRVAYASQEAFKFYKRNAKHRIVKDTYYKSDWSKMITAFWDVIGEEMVERKAGVFIQGFGYFVNILTPIKRVYSTKDRRRMLNLHTDSMVYSPAFIPMFRGWRRLIWTADKRIKRGIKNKVSKKLKEGFKYLNHYPLVKSLKSMKLK